MDLIEAGHHLGFDEVARLLTMKPAELKQRHSNAVAYGHYYRAQALEAVINRVEKPYMGENPNPTQPPAQRAPIVVPDTFETGRTVAWLEFMLEKLLCGLEINHNEQTIFELAKDFAQLEHEHAGN